MSMSESLRDDEGPTKVSKAAEPPQTCAAALQSS
jgi:hypothetical protein